MSSRKHIDILLNAIIRRSPLQRKKISAFLSSQSDDYFQRAEQFASDYLGYLENNGIALDYAVDAYLSLCQDMITARMKFLKTGIYNTASLDEVNRGVYQNETEMKAYMIGLAISQFMWASHYDFFCAFSRQIGQRASHLRSYLEIGPGHGLFLNAAIKSLPARCGITAIDISPHSIGITRSIMAHFGHDRRDIRYITGDVFDFSSENPFDFITMGEVLEHVERPDLLLIKLHEMLAPGGALFISTCVNCPARDHVYHFKRVEDIRDMLRACRFDVLQEIVRPVEQMPMKEIIEKKVTINYCALIQGA